MRGGGVEERGRGGGWYRIQRVNYNSEQKSLKIDYIIGLCACGALFAVANPKDLMCMDWPATVARHSVYTVCRARKPCLVISF